MTNFAGFEHGRTYVTWMSRRDLGGWSRRLKGVGTNTYFGTYSKNLEGVPNS
jgi:hypothetical protein